jgi:adenylate cyclase
MRVRSASLTPDTNDVLQAILESVNDAIVSVDDRGRVLLWNPHAEALFGYAASEMLGETLDRIIPERFHESHRQGISRVAGGGEQHVIGATVELAAVRRDGTEFPIELSLARAESDGKTIFTGIIRDVTERARLSRALTESQARMKAIVDSANDAIISVGDDGTVQLWNPHAERLFGFTAAEMLGERLERIIPERYREAHHAGIERLAGGGEPHVIGSTVELAALHRDGREFPIELSLAQWESDGRRSFSGIVRDITRRKQAEDDLQVANVTLAEKNDMLEGLSAKLAKYLSRQVYESIFEGRTEVRVESYRKLVTVFFSDIQGFTELADRMEAEPLGQLLNRYLSDMSNVASAHGGTVDKFIGDGIMIFFGDPETRGEREDAIACARMALEMRSRIEDLRPDWRRAAGGAVELHVRMGINTGYCTVGNFGSEERLDYTIVGREVNEAARLETTAKPDQIHISHQTYELIKDEIHCEPAGEITVKGVAYPMRTYEVVGIAGAPGDDSTAGVTAGLGVDLDPSKLTPAERAAAQAELRHALGVLERSSEGASSNENQ